MDREKKNLKINFYTLSHEFIVRNGLLIEPFSGITKSQILIVNENGIVLTGTTINDLSNSSHTHTIEDLIDVNKLSDFQSHTSDTSIHFSKNSISLNDLSNSSHTHTITDLIDVNKLSDFQSHTSDTSIHFQKNSISLSDLSNSSHTHMIEDLINVNKLSDFQSHTSDTSIHFQKNSISLNDLYDVNTANTQQGYYLSYSAGTWVGIPDSTDLSNYYTKNQIYNTGETFTRNESDSRFVYKTGDTLSGHLNVPSLSANSINIENYIDFNTGISNTIAKAGRTYYDKGNNTLSFFPQTDNMDVAINMGQENVIRIYNDTGQKIYNGQVVHILNSYINGEIHVTVNLAIASDNTGCTSIISGIATHDIENLTHGFITTFGLVRNLCTTGFTNGQRIYLSDTIHGAFADFDSLQTASKVNKIGVVVTTGYTDGIILVQIENESILSILSQRQFNNLSINNSSNGIISFSGLTINVDNTKFDIGAIKGWLTDNTTNTQQPTITYIDFSGQTAITPNYLASNPATYIAINKDYNIIQQEYPFTNTQKRSLIDLGVIVHSNNIFINATNTQPEIQIDLGHQYYDLINSLGFFNVSGNIFNHNDANLFINKSSGYIFKQGCNFVNDIKNPHQKYMAPLSALTFNYRLQNSVEYSGYTQIDPNNYDLNGVRTSVDSDKYTVQRIAIFSSNLVRIQYGQAVYNTMDDAIIGITTEEFVREQNIQDNGLTRCYLIVKQNTIDLSDTDSAMFIQADRFGSVGGSAGGTTITTLQKAYDNSITPEIITDLTRGSVDFRIGLNNPNTDNLLTFQNSASTIVGFVNGDGLAYYNTITAATIFSVINSAEISRITSNLNVTGTTTLNVLNLQSGQTNIYGISNDSGLTNNSENYLATVNNVKSYVDALNGCYTFVSYRNGETVSSGVDMFKFSNIPTNLNPFIVPFDSTIVAITMSSKDDTTWTGLTLVNNVVAITTTLLLSNSGYSVQNYNVNNGDKIRTRIITNNIVTDSNMILYIKKRI